MLKMYKLSYYIFPLMLGFLSMDTIAAINVYSQIIIKPIQWCNELFRTF